MEKHKIGIFFQVSIVFRQILNFPPWVKGLTFIFQAFLHSGNIDIEKNGVPGCPISFWLIEREKEEPKEVSICNWFREGPSWDLSR